ncbi:maleylpyruvate isomerase family mycothiol-dependent enzyme [Streptomyces sp. NPDC051211]|uniref:maleylpyruvate isomerase family mycothiol-dependent enzyme n=1 Tax=Streptomyces sp. NPDC051211 TaxID=3154643 RepID=UPI00344CD9F1
MDYISVFRSETSAFQRAVGRAVGAGEGAPLVPSCPGWSVSDLVGHLGGVHRYVAHILREGTTEAPDHTDLSLYGLPADPAVLAAWPIPDRAPNLGPVPVELTEWFAEGALALEEQFRAHGSQLPVWTWSAEQSSGFWLRIQAIEAALHRWDAEGVTDAPAPVDTGLAVDAVGHTFEVMAPFRRAVKQAPPGLGERYRFRQTDGNGDWTVRFEGDQVRFDEGPADAELAGTASELMLFLWNRIPASDLEADGDPTYFERYFELVPPV